MVGKVRDLEITCLDNTIKAHDVLKTEVPNLALDDSVKNLFTAFKIFKQEVPYDSHKNKKTFAGVLGFIGAAVGAAVGAAIGAALIATGVLAPLGIGLIATIAIVAIGGAVIGSTAIGVTAGLASGAVVDKLVNKPEPTEKLEIKLDKPQEPKSSDSYPSMMKRNVFESSNVVNLGEESNNEQPKNKGSETVSLEKHEVQNIEGSKTVTLEESERQDKEYRKTL